MRCIDLFSGCGGMSLGFIQAGFSISAAYENWDQAVACYRKNFNHPIHQMDLSCEQEVLVSMKQYDYDVIIGGPPCQDFSPAGKRVEGARAGLTISYARIVSELLPKYFVMENVSAAKNSDAYKVARKIFKESNYGLTELVINSAYCGVPQNRRRFFCVGAVQTPDEFLKQNIEMLLSEDPTTVKDYFGQSLNIEKYYRHPRTYQRRGVFSVDEPAPTVRGSNRPMPKTYVKHKDDIGNPPVETIRTLTFSERSQVQTFPTTFQWQNTASVNEQLLGNAVPVKMAELVANALVTYDLDTELSSEVV